MDQLRTALVWLQRQHFWVLWGLVALIAIGCWAKASGQLTTLFDKNQQQSTPNSPAYKNSARIRSTPTMRSTKSKRLKPSSNPKAWPSSGSSFTTASASTCSRGRCRR